MRKVVVLFGGKSCEREISVLTGVFAVNILQAAGHGVLPVYIHTDGKFYTASGMTDVRFFRSFNRTKLKEIFFYGDTVYAFNKLCVRIFTWICRVKSVHVGKDCQKVCLHTDCNERGKGVVIAHLDFFRCNRIVFVDNRERAERQKAGHRVIEILVPFVGRKV